MEEESCQFVDERSERSRSLNSRQSKELVEFDEESSRMGLNALQIATLSQEEAALDDESIRGSMLSLSASSSSSSFASNFSSQTAL